MLRIVCTTSKVAHSWYYIRVSRLFITIRNHAYYCYFYICNAMLYLHPESSLFLEGLWSHTILSTYPLICSSESLYSSLLPIPFCAFQRSFPFAFHLSALWLPLGKYICDDGLQNACKSWSYHHILGIHVPKWTRKKVSQYLTQWTELSSDVEHASSCHVYSISINPL